MKRILVLLSVLGVALSTGPFPHAQGCGSNPIVCENNLTGNLPSEWDISGAGDASIQGFATDISVNKGDTVHFKINSTASAYRLDIYRLGYYGGMGARKVATIPNVTGRNQAACLTNNTTFLVDCGNWAESATWTVPATAVSGIYIAKLSRSDTGGKSHIVFVVRDDASTSDLLFQTSDTTWQAYNQYGGNSLYVGRRQRAYKVSYNRPSDTRDERLGKQLVFYAEYPMVRWLEANGYDVSYFTGVDTDRGRRADQEPQSVPVGRPRRVLVGRTARERRGGPRRRRPPGLLQRKRGLLEDAVGSEHRRLEHALPDASHLQGNPRERRDRPGGPTDVDRYMVGSAIQSAW